MVSEHRATLITRATLFVVESARWGKAGSAVTVVAGMATEVAAVATVIPGRGIRRSCGWSSLTLSPAPAPAGLVPASAVTPLPPPSPSPCQPSIHFQFSFSTSATTAVSKHPFLRFAHKKQTFHLKPSARFMTNDWSVSRRVQIEEVGKEKEGGVWLRERARKGERRCS